MTTRRRRKQRRRLRALETALATRASPTEVVTPLRKSQYTMASMPLPRTSSDVVEPVYPTQIPVIEPWMTPTMFGAYQRGRLWNSYGSGVSFELLRLAVKRCLLLQAIHQVCAHDMLMMSKRARTPEVLGWRIQHEAHEDEQVDTETSDIAGRCTQLERLFQCPHPLYERSFRGFLAKVVDDYLTLNRVAIELIRNRRGEIRQFRAIDAATILPTYRVLQRYIGVQYGESQRPMAWDVAARLLEHETGMPIIDSEYVCVMRGQLIGTFAPGEILVWEDMPVTDVRVIFPPSYCEKALEGIISWIYAFHYNRNYFSHGNPIEVILGIKGDLQDDSFVALQEQMRENFSGIKGAWRVPLVQLPVDGAFEVIPLKKNHQEMQFTEWMATLEELACSIYRVNRKRVNADQRAHAGSMGGHSTQARQQEIEASKEESFKVHSAFLTHHFTQLVRLMDPDMEFVWTGLDIAERDDEVKVEQIEVTTYRDIDELRIKHGDAPYNKPWSQLPLHQLIFQAEGLVMTGGGGGDQGEDQGQPEKSSPSDDAIREAGAALGAER